MPAPSLSEITSIRGNPAIAAGTSGTASNLAELPADYQAIQFLQTAALDKSRANQYALEQMQQNFQQRLQGFNAIDVDGLMESDYAEIVPEYGRLLGDLYANYDVIANPLRNREKSAELAQKEGAFRAKVAQSKQDKLLRTTVGNFISQHPDYSNDGNMALLQRFSGSKMGSEGRNPAAILNLMPSFDTKQAEISKLANMAAEQKTAEQDTASPFQTTTSRIEYRDSAFRDAVTSLLNGTDEYNRVVLDQFREKYNQAPAQLQQMYRTPQGDPDVARFAVDQYYMPLRNQTDTTTQVVANPYAMNEDEHKKRMAEIAARAAQERRNMKYAKDLGDEELNNLASELAVRQLNVFGSANDPNAPKETIRYGSVKQSTGDKNADKAIDDFAGLFGVSGRPGAQSAQGVPLNIDTWLMNAYSVPTGKQKTLNEDGKVTEEDSFMRPERAWITTETDPNARKVVVRYGEGENARDLVLPYAEHFQLLNNVAGQNNALKLGGAKSKLLQQLTGKVSPNFNELSAVERFKNPNTGGGTITPSQPTAPVNQTTGQFNLNATEYLKNRKKK